MDALRCKETFDNVIFNDESSVEMDGDAFIPIINN
jgi:hypothetical protein